MSQKTQEAQAYPIGPKRNEVARKLPYITYCDGQHHIKTQGAWGVDVCVGMCPQFTGQAMTEAVHRETTEEHQSMTWANYNDIRGDGEKVKAWVQTAGKILIMNGPSGLGKTHMSRAMQYQAIDEGKSVEYVSSTDLKLLFLDANPSNHERVEDFYRAKNKIKRLTMADLLIIDDLGDESRTGVVDTFVSGLKDLLDKMNGRLVITMNLGLMDENKIGNLGQYGGRIYSRLTGGAEILPLSGDDYRKKL